jgi:hypothetical protein
MPTHQTTDEKPAVIDPSLFSSDGEPRVRELAVKQIERKCRFHVHAVSVRFRAESLKREAHGC